MCIIFLWRREVHQTFGKYKFILAANRDESFYRPAKQAHFWLDNPNVLAGQDMTEGSEGGTWLGVTKQGRISFLTNVRTGVTATQNDLKKGRGVLTSNFLKTDQSALSYLEGLEEEKYLFRPFNLVAGNICGDMFYVTNADKNSPVPLKGGFTCLTNDVLESKWLKAKNGSKLFSDVVENCEDNLIENLFTVLDDTTRNYPDPAVTVSHPANEYLSSVFIPMILEYGTRANTIITVDNDNNVTFVERTIAADSAKGPRNVYEFTIHNCKL